MPCSYGSRPVRMLVCEGSVVTACACANVKRAPCAASRSRFGVLRRPAVGGQRIGAKRVDRDEQDVLIPVRIEHEGRRSAEPEGCSDRGQDNHDKPQQEPTSRRLRRDDDRVSSCGPRPMELFRGGQAPMLHNAPCPVMCGHPLLARATIPDPNVQEEDQVCPWCPPRRSAAGSSPNQSSLDCHRSRRADRDCLRSGPAVLVRQLGRPVLYHREPEYWRRPDVAQRAMGAHDRILAVLASDDVAVASARRSVVRAGCGSPSRHEPAPALPRHARRVRPVPSDDGGDRPERLPGRDVCRASAARRVRRLDRRTEGRAQHLVLGPCALGVRRATCGDRRLAATSGLSDCSRWP